MVNVFFERKLISETNGTLSYKFFSLRCRYGVGSFAVPKRFWSF